VNTFSPEGRLFQVEYALEAIKLGSTALGIRTSEGVVLAVEKRVSSPLMESSSIEKLLELDSHVACALSGLVADARTIVDHARLEAQNHWFTFDEQIKVESLTRSVCDLALRFGEGVDGQEAIMSRPFGVALLIGGVDEHGPQLYFLTTILMLTVDTLLILLVLTRHTKQRLSVPALKALKTNCRKTTTSMTLTEAKTLALKVLKQVMEEKLSASNIQVSTVSESGFVILTEQQVQDIIDSL
jgi:20S proteasome subunit alpha 5